MALAPHDRTDCWLEDPAAASSWALYDFETASLRNEERVTSSSRTSHLVKPMDLAFSNVAVGFLIGQMDPRFKTADRPSVRT